MSIDKKISGLLNEDPDAIKKDRSINADSRDARVFGFDRAITKATIGGEGDYHFDIGNSRASFSYPGRLWTKSKIISFWHYPREREEFDELIKLLNEVLRGDQVKIDKTWRIDVNEKLVDIDRFLNDDVEVKDNDMGKEHVKSPMEKKKNTSKNSGKDVKLPKGMTLAQYYNLLKKEDVEIFDLLILENKSTFQVLKDNKIELTPEERKEAMDAKCVWHHGPNSEETCAIWKAKDSSGKVWYISNTHRCYQKAPTLKGAIKKFEFVKSTS